MTVKRSTASGRFVANALPRLEAALLLVQQGCPISAACAKERVHKDTWYDHLRRAEQARGKARPTAADRRLIGWADQAQLATEAAEGWLYERFIEQATLPRGKGNWLPWLKVLALRFPDRWAERRQALPDEEPSEHDLEKLTREELVALRDLVRKTKETHDGRRLRAV